MKLTKEQLDRFRQSLGGKTTIIADEQLPKESQADVQELPLLVSAGLMRVEELEAGKHIYTLTTAGLVAIGPSSQSEEETQAAAKRAYLMFRGGNDDVNTVPAWHYLSDSMQKAFIDIYRTALVDAERQFSQTKPQSRSRGKATRP